MKKYFVVADVHSYFNEMLLALQKAGYDPMDPNHVFVSLGDLFDRGPSPLECLAFVNAIPADRKVLIRGNHEDLLIDCLARGVFFEKDMQNGTMDTVFKLAGEHAADLYQRNEGFLFSAVWQDPALRAYFAELRDCAEIGDYLFVHGWLPEPEPDEEDRLLGNWRAARWFNGMEKWRQGDRPTGKTVLCGHWHASWGHAVIEGKGTEFGEEADYSPFVQPGIIALDACTSHSHKVNCVVLEI